MRICFIADANHPNTLNWSGYMATDLCHEVHVISLNRPRFTNNHVAFHHVDLPTSSKVRYLLPMTSFNTIIDGISPHLLVGYRLTSYAFMAAKTGFHPLVVVAQSQKAAGDFRVIRRPLQWLAARYAVRHADLALAWAPHMERDIISLGGNKDRIFTLPRGVDLRIFEYRPNYDNNGLNIVTTRGLNPGYNLEMVLRAVANLSPKISGLKYSVIGDGCMKDHLARLSTRLGIEKQVEFLGGVSYDSIPNHLSRSDLYISPVPEDGVSASLLEAMAVGIFPIVTDIEANRYWREQGCTFLRFNPKSLDDLVDKILFFYRNRQDCRKHLSVNRAIVERKASWVHNMKTIDAVLRSLSEKN